MTTFPKFCNARALALVGAPVALVGPGLAGNMAAGSSPAVVAQEPSATSIGKPTVVLVRGAWAGTFSWKGEVDRLQRDGYVVRAFANPLRGLTGDAADLADFLKTIPGPIVLVGHSYGGSVITNAVSQDLQSILLIVLFGIGTDYILLLLFRYRERLRAGDDKADGVIVAVERVCEVIASAAAAVIVAFLVLLLASLGFFGSLGPALAIAVGVMLVTALTVIPASVSLLGRYVFWPSRSWQRQPNATLSHRIGASIGARPAVLAAASAGLLVALTAGCLWYKADYDFSAGVPQDNESARAAADLQRGFAAGAVAPTDVYLTPRTQRPLPTNS